MISSASDIYALLGKDPVLGSLATFRVVDQRIPVEAGEGVFIYIKKYPEVEEFTATWNLWIVDYDDNPLDVILAQMKQLLPGFKILKDDVIIKASTTGLRSGNDQALTQEVYQITQPVPSYDLEARFAELEQDIKDRMLLVSAGKDGRDGTDGRDGIDADITEIDLDSLSDVYTANAKKNDILGYDGDKWVARSLPNRKVGGGGSAISQASLSLLGGLLKTGEPMGHEDRTQSTIEFNDETRTFSISPVVNSFTVWVRSKPFEINSTREIQIPDAVGLYYIYFNTSGVLSYKTSFFDFDSEAFTSYVYWDSSISQCKYLADERHGIVLDWQTHEYLHRTRGAAIANGFDISGYTIGGTGDLESDVQFDIGNGTFYDEDIKIDITHSETPDVNSFEQVLQGAAELSVLYRVGTTWKFDAPNSIPLKPGVDHIYYNSIVSGSGSIVESSANKYVNYYIAATNNLKAPVISLMGQYTHTNISNAETESFSDLQLEGFPSKEFRFLYKIIYRTSNYTNSSNAIISKIQDIRYYSDIPSTII